MREQATPEIPLERFESWVDGLDHPEGLAFDSEGILWAGGEAGQIYRIAAKHRVEEVTNIGGFCLGLVFSPEDELFVCNAKLRAVVRVGKDGKSALFADRAGDHELVTPNTGVFDGEGNLYVADSGEWYGNNGYIVRFDRRGKGSIFAGPLAFPNGTALSQDEGYLYVAESNTNRVLRIEIRSNGTAGDIRPYVDGLERVPDGLAVDEEGNLLVTCYASHKLYRVSTDGNLQILGSDPDGTILAGPTNVAFAGLSRDDIYVANLGRWHITRAPYGTHGHPLVNQR